jgi:hypothetical protein
VLAISASVPVRSWWFQRGQLVATQAQLDALEGEVAELEAARERWRDPAFVRAQARERLNYVLPGEVGVVVVGLDEVLATEPAPDAGVVVPARVDDAPWWVPVWDGFEAAGGTATGPEVPAESVGGAAPGSPE